MLNLFVLVSLIISWIYVRIIVLYVDICKAGSKNKYAKMVLISVAGVNVRR